MKTLWEKGENAGNRHFLLFPQCFPKSSSQGLLTLSQTTNFRLFQTQKNWQTTISNYMKMAVSSP